MACLRWSLGLASRLRPLFAMPHDRLVDEPGFFVIPTVSYENRQHPEVVNKELPQRIRSSGGSYAARLDSLLQFAQFAYKGFFLHSGRP